MSYKKPLGDPNITQKRMVANSKYEGVSTGVDSGVNVNTTRVLRENEMSVKQQKGELFKRMRPSSLGNFLSKKLQDLQLEAQMAEMDDDEANHLRIAMGQALPGGGNQQNNNYNGSSPQQQHQGGGGGFQQAQLQQHNAVMMQHQMEYQLPKTPSKEIFVVDLRERDEFAQCHIGSAFHYPAAKLSHAMHSFPPEILKYKNKENTVVVLYDLEEELVSVRKCGNIFVERGFDNLVVLSGGLKEFVQEHSSMIVGQSPVPIIPKPQALLHGRRTVANRTTTGSQAGSVRGGSTRGTSIASSKPKSLTSSLARPRGASVSASSTAGSSWY